MAKLRITNDYQTPESIQLRYKLSKDLEAFKREMHTRWDKSREDRKGN